MASSGVEICNRALGLVGSPFIASLDDAKQAARLCKRIYPEIRDEMLRDHDWNFASMRALLPALTTAPLWGFDDAYQLPGDCLCVREIDGLCPRDDWRVEARTISISLSAPLKIRYTAQRTDTGLFDPGFTSALAYAVAAEICMPLTNNATLAGNLRQEADMRMSGARGKNFVEGADRGNRPYLVLDIRI